MKLFSILAFLSLAITGYGQTNLLGNASKGWTIQQIDSKLDTKIQALEWQTKQLVESEVNRKVDSEVKRIVSSDSILKIWVKSYVDNKVKETNTSKPSPPPTPNEPPVVIDTVTTKKCPFITVSVFPIAIKGIAITYSGDAKQIRCQVISANNKFKDLINTEVTPSTKTFTIGYPNFPKGDYILTLTAIGCTGTHTQNFTVK